MCEIVVEGNRLKGRLKNRRTEVIRVYTRAFRVDKDTVRNNQKT